MKNIIAENKKYVRAVIRKFTGQDNADVEQEVYIKIWQNLSKYQENGRFKQWVCTLTANLCRDYFRSKGFKISQNAVNDDEILENTASYDRPDEKAESKRRQKIILKAVDDLPKMYREVVVLFEFEDFTLEDISKRLKVPVGTVKSRLYNARQILKEKLSFLKGE